MRKTLWGSVTIAALVLSVATPVAAFADNDDDPTTFSVSGHVTTGSPDAVVSVTLFDAAGNDVADTDSSDIPVSSNGDYTITDVPAGTYTAYFSDNRNDQDNAFLSRYLGDVVTDDQTTPGIVYFDVTTGDVSNINGTLALVSWAQTTKPTISGTPKFGKTLKVDTGDWAENPDFDYQWYNGNTAIADATDDNYEIDATDLGDSVHVVVTVSEQGYADFVASSNSIAIPAGAKITAVKPTITGTAKVGKTLAAVHGVWKPSGVKFSYQWLLNGKPIPKATKAKLKLTKAYAGKKVRVVVTGGKVGVGGAFKASKAVKVKRK
jgi:hypothetical protein